jgi:hypothetical protein
MSMSIVSGANGATALGASQSGRGGPDVVWQYSICEEMTGG